ncbi:MAG: hypothetical protein S4CHLAM37_13020 [Chlamydiia bacterium]|nr:hypothetical protein [Chlamydiia bacterium]
MSSANLYVHGSGVDQLRATLLIQNQSVVSTMSKSGGKKKDLSFVIHYSEADTAQRIKDLIQKELGIDSTHLSLSVSGEDSVERTFEVISDEQKLASFPVSATPEMAAADAVARAAGIARKTDAIWINLAFSCPKVACDFFDSASNACSYLSSLVGQKVFIYD